MRLFTASQGRPDQKSAPAGRLAAGQQPMVTLGQFNARLDLAVEIGATTIELTQAGQPSGAEFLLKSATARDELLGALSDRGLKLAALNCSGMPLHPVRGAAHQALIDTTIRLAEKLAVNKLVSMSGVGGDGADATTINWAFMPWPDDQVALRERQWAEGITFWHETGQRAVDHGITRIALELHPLHLVYNVPTLWRLRDAVGPVIGATVDPSHLFWQAMDPVVVLRVLGEAVYHVQLKDTELVQDQIAIAGALDNRPMTDPSQRAWLQRSIGRGHDIVFWADFINTLRQIGYEGAVTIENEDPFLSYEAGVREAGDFLRPLFTVPDASADSNQGDPHAS